MLEVGRVVRSNSGHDKDRFYAVVAVKEGRVTIADGKLRKLSKPKEKNVLHVSPTSLILDMGVVITDKKLREALLHLNRAAETEGGN
jgi:ribosomal protein L14E/L6E/L27E